MSKLTDANVVRLIVERISDASLSVQLAAIQAAISLTQEYSGDLLRLGVLNLIDPILNQYFLSEYMMPNSKQDEQLIISIVQSTIYLLEALCRENENFISSLKSSPIISESMNKILAKNSHYISPCLDLLNAYSEDNPDAQNLLSHNFQEFYALVTDANLSPDNKMNIVSLIANVCLLNDQEQYLEEYVMFPCAKSLQVDIFADLVSSVLPHMSLEAASTMRLEVWTSGVKAQEISLEIITNLLAVDEDETPIGEKFMSPALIASMIKAASGISQEISPSVESHPELLSLIFDLQCSSFYCIQNLLLNTNLLTQSVNVQEFWEFLFAQLNKILEFLEDDSDCKQSVEDLVDSISKVILCYAKKHGEEIVIFI